MPPKCYICNFYDPRKVSLFRIPDRNDEYSERGGLWLKLLDESSENIHRIRICSQHFLKKKPAKSGDYLDLDWVPNKNLGKFSKNWKLVEYHFRKKVKNSPVQNSNQSEVNENYQLQPSTANWNATNTRNDNSINFDLNVGSTHNNNSINFDLNVANSKKKQPQGVQPNVSLNKPLVVLKSANTNTNNSINYDLNVGNTNTNQQLNIPVNVLLNTPKPVYESQSAHEHSIPDRFTGPVNSLIPSKRDRVHILGQKLFFPKEIQTDLSASDVDLLFQYYQDAVDERNTLLTKISTMVIDIDYLKGNDKKTRFYTGLTTWSLLENFFQMVQEFLPTHPKCKLSRFQMVVLTLMKLRLNLTFTDIGYRFQIDETTASRYFYRCLYILYKLFHNSKLVHWPSERTNLLQNTPSYFRSTFKESITIIVDCFEIFSERSSMLRAAAQAFSNYKHHATLKFLIGISTTGVIIFISPAFGGRSSDKEIVAKSGFLDNLKEGDIVLADKGFLIEQELKAKQVSLKIPCFVKNGNQLHPTEVELSRDYSRIRIHVERMINLLRRKFNICSDIARMSAIAKQNDLFDNDLYDKILLVCSCLVNICPSIVNTDFEI